MEGKDEIKELFSQKLGSYEAKVDPSLWNGIASQLGTTAVTAASTGMSLLTKVIIGASISVAVITTAVMLIPNDSEPKTTAEIPTIVSNKIQEKESVSTQIDQNINDKESQNGVITEGSSEETREENHSNESITQFEMPITEFEEGLIDEDCIDCDLAERNEEEINDESVSSNSDEKLEEEIDAKENNDKTEDNSAPYIAPKPVYYIQQYTNVFTPNRDGTNDLFELKIEGLENFQIIILDFANGKEVFESRSTDFTWDGTDQFGNPVKEGDYIYMINAQDFDGNPIREIKSLTLRISQ